MKRKCLAVGIILLFIGVAIAPGINLSVGKTEHTRRTHFLNNSSLTLPFINFNSWVKIEYDAEYVNQTEFIPNNAYMIPAKISFKVDVPNWLLHSYVSLFQLLKNWFLFHSLVIPNMIVNVSTENVPSWAEIFPSTSNILVSPTNEWTMTPFTLVLILHNQAPPGPFVFTLNAEAPALHRINGYYTNISIAITVQ
jgi:hypothetical protein